ncbi:MAG: glycosyltransferase [Xanthomonadaceae bacterium]|nr:glycosyltransferase [Xanthomonadaceae bacterium]
MARETPLISVALCTWNGARWLRPQLDSILTQEDVALELVVLDDASTDDTLAILREYVARDGRIRLHANAGNLGHLRSFGTCMGMCTGDFIAPADQDDVWHPRKLRTLSDAMGEHSLAYCDSRYIDADGQPTGRKVSDDLPMRSGREVLPILLQNSVSGHAALMRREVFSVAQPFPRHGYHDWWLAMIAATHHGIAYVDEPLVDFRRHAGNCSAVGHAHSAATTISRSQREADWFRQRTELAHVFVQRYGICLHPRLGEWAGLLERLSTGEARGLFALAWRDRDVLGGPLAALRLAASYGAKARRIRRAHH